MTLSLALQFLASITTLAGVWLGSTERAGAAWYAGSMVFWWWLMFHDGLWGLGLLNAAMTVVTARNVYKTWIARV